MARLTRGDVANVSFRDMCALLQAIGFELRRVSGSHHIFGHTGFPELVNLQEVDGKAKPYQIRQVLRLVRRYALTVEDKR